MQLLTFLHPPPFTVKGCMTKANQAPSKIFGAWDPLIDADDTIVM